MNIVKKSFNPALCCLALLINCGVAQAITLSLSTAQHTGTTLTTDLRIADLGDGIAPSLSTYDLDIQFDATHLAYSSTQFGDSALGNQLDLFGFSSEYNASQTATGRINLFEISLDLASDLNDLQAESFTLATLSFKVLRAGNSLLTPSINVLGDAQGNALSASVNSSQVSTVPVPAAIWLMGTGLFALLSRKTLMLHGGGRY